MGKVRGVGGLRRGGDEASSIKRRGKRGKNKSEKDSKFDAVK